MKDQDKVAQSQPPVPRVGGNTNNIGVWTGHEISDDPSLDFVEFVKLSDATRLAGQSQATKVQAVPINMNDSFTVTLTAFGAQVRNDHYAWMREKYPEAAPKLSNAGDVLTEQLWELMKIFGACIHLGMSEVPFKGNVITPMVRPTAQEVTQQAAPSTLDLEVVLAEFDRLCSIPKTPGYCNGAKHTRAEALAMALASVSIPETNQNEDWHLLIAAAEALDDLGATANAKSVREIAERIAPATQQSAKAETAEQAEGEQVNVLVAQPKLYARLMEMSDIIRADARWTGNEVAFADKSESDVAMLDDILGDALRLAAEPPVAQVNVLPSTRGTESQQDADESALLAAVGRALAYRSADVCSVNREDNWKIYSEDFIEDAKVALDAARRFRAQGGNTNADSSDLAPTTSTVSASDEIRNAALEEAAKVADATPVVTWGYFYAPEEDGYATRDNIAESIRALKSTAAQAVTDQAKDKP